MREEVMTTEQKIKEAFDQYRLKGNFMASYPEFEAGYLALLNSHELEQCRKDAERYRALRKSNLDDIDVCTGFYAVDVGSSGVAAAYEEILYGEKLDAAIDKAMESV